MKANLDNVNARITSACERAGRHRGEVSLLAVSKRQPAISVRRLYGAGQRAFGENYVVEALEKQAELGDLQVEWHYVGPVQSNKTVEIARAFDWVHSIDREKILRRLSRQRPAHLAELNVCIQVNIDCEEQKSGVPAEDAEPLAHLAATLPGIKLRGLMAIPRAPDDGQATSASFRAMNLLYRRLQAAGLPLDTLSMGMSADLEDAIAAGSTMVRIGTGLFGPRT